MDLMNTVKRSSAVYVNGTTYEIDDQGVCKGLSEADGEKLLLGKTWSEWDGSDPRQRLEDARAARREKYKSQHAMALVKNNTSEAQEAAAIAKAAEKEVDTNNDGNVVVEHSDPPVPDEGEEWADPDPSYSMEWLAACADAYSVKLKKKDTPEMIVEKLKKAMYE